MSVPAAVFKLDGLPFRISVEAVGKFFSEVDVNPAEIHLLVNRDLRPSGVGFITVNDENEIKPVMQMDGKNVGDMRRYVKVTRSDQEELNWHLKRQELYKSNDPSVLFSVRLYGLPYKVTEYDIAKWIEKESECLDVQIHLNHQGRPSGDATVYFITMEKAKKALERHGQQMNERYVEMQLDDVSVSFSNAVGSSNAVRLTGLPFRATEQDIRKFFLPEAECQSVRVILNKEGRPSGDAIVEFETEDLMEIAMKKNREHLGNRFVVLTRERDHQSPPKSRSSANNRGIDHDGSSRYAIKMSGLPYRLSEREIIDWFLPLTCARARILKNRDNKPSGEAIAEFNNEEDANNAMKKNKKYLGERFVVLTCQWS